ncbi:OPT oligopeptide transporter protein-domain-containing protein [Suillus subluteus]|nr:OPT oligopeptide transporter protein-domain-containing protein [Suillus subluteus]
MPTEFVSESAAFPLQLLDSKFNSADLRVESEVTEDQQVDSDDHVQPLSSKFDDESPYPEVRSAVANTDDPSIHVTTLRTWVLGLAWAIIMPGVNQFFFFRYPTVPITGIVAQLLSFPIGRLCAAYLPRKKILGISLNPGPFTIKEHVLITIMASVGATSAYATDIIAVQRVYYNQKFSFSYQWFLVMSTQLIGFSTGGITRRFLVSPPSMIWPATLVSCALFNTLHSEQYAGIGRLGGLSRERFFVYVFTSAFLWFQALSWFSWVTWISPDNAVVSQLFGYGMSVVTFDWAQIAYIGSPLAMPWWATANIIIGFVIFYWIVTPILYFTNTWYSLYMPTFNVTAYEEYSPIFIPNVLATIVHCYIHFRKQIWYQARRSLEEQADIHARLMSRYPQVPEWWYLSLFALMFALAFTYVIPCGMIQAITNHKLAMMLFKTYGYITMYQALTFTSDFKLGHYMKIPPRKMFWCQIVAAIIAGTTQMGVQSWMFSTIPDICSSTQKDGFTCPNTEVFGTASIFWVSPVMGWLAMKRYPNSIIRYMNPLIFNGTSKIPPASALNYVPWAYVHSVCHTAHFAWWTKYNYVLSAALDAGLAVSVIFIFFVLQYPANGSIGESLQHWWGNTVFNTTADGMGTPVRQLHGSETFGPSMGSW